MNWVRISLVLLLAVLFAGLGGLNAEAGEEVIHQGVLIPYEITGPDGWIHQVNPHHYVLGVFLPEAEALYPYISLTVAGGPFQKDLTPEQLVERNLYERPGARLISSNWVKTDGGCGFLLAEFSWSSKLGEVRAIKAFHPSERQVLVVTGACLAEDYAQYQDVFTASLMSVRVKGHPEKAKKPVDDEAAETDPWATHF